MRFAIALAFFSLAGCASEAVLVNDKGEKRYCYRAGSSGAPFSSAGSNAEFARCLNDAGTAGFRKVE